MANEAPLPKASIEMQRLVNDLIGNASHLWSEFPMKQMRCSKKVDELREALLTRLAELEELEKIAKKL